MENQKAKEGQAIDKHEISTHCEALSIFISSLFRAPKRHYFSYFGGGGRWGTEH